MLPDRPFITPFCSASRAVLSAAALVVATCSCSIHSRAPAAEADTAPSNIHTQPAETTAAAATTTAKSAKTPESTKKAPKGAVSVASTDAQRPPTSCPSADKPERLAYRTALKFMSAKGPTAGRLMAEAVRTRLAQLFSHGCVRQAADKRLTKLIQKWPSGLATTDPNSGQTDLFAKSAVTRVSSSLLLGTGVRPAGNHNWVALYRIRGSQRSDAVRKPERRHGQQEAVEMLIVVTDKPEAAHTLPDPSGLNLGAMMHELSVLDTEVLQPRPGGEPMLIVTHTHPWVASCWRSMTLLALTPGAHPHHPKAVIERTFDGYWCDGAPITKTAAGFIVDITGWPGFLRGVGSRPYRYAYKFDARGLRETYGFAPSFPDDPTGSSVFAHLIEDWLGRAWALSREAVVAGSAGQLRAAHARLRAERAAAKKGEFTMVVVAQGARRRRTTVYCERGTGEACAGWERPVDFHLELSRDDLWRIRKVHQWRSRKGR